MCGFGSFFAQMPIGPAPALRPDLHARRRLVFDNDRLGQGKLRQRLPIGAAFPHEDGKGYNIILQALPIDGRVVLRAPKDDDPKCLRAAPCLL
jgi:hypothetical protein